MEMAILAPFLLVLLVSIIDIGRLERYDTIVGNSARAGVQYGAQNVTTALDFIGQKAAAQNDAQSLSGLTESTNTYCQCSDASPATCLPPSTCPTGTHMLEYVSVTATYSFKTLFNYHVIPSTIPLTRTETMQVAQ